MILNSSVVNKEFKRAEQGQQAEALIEELLATDHSSWESHLSFTDESIDPDEVSEDWYPDHDVTLAVDPTSGYGAMRWTGMIDNVLVPFVTYNPNTEPNIDLLRDGGTPHFFPHSAVLPVDDVRMALLEFARTGQRPECVSWQEFDRL
ncbi:Immunity protein Imm1 [Actinopolyspora lacussalsi subsp. righensis]|uniref:Immunity protein Imm1 n=1 Tax=Actinopolyspora righensis TaxID=995060 RepID=A0A1I7BC84_9ACTN|nr:Imm1 family immunity protein [Actinopolyspora righensis]SFT84806.1 Immunity protein Imm1 [Actinopolyspora righensis]